MSKPVLSVVDDSGDRHIIAQMFLSALDKNAELFTYQVLDDNKDRRDPALRRIIHGALTAETWEALEAFNRQGAGVFVAVNETDGKGRKLDNITRIRAVWCEHDGGSSPDLPLPPSITVRSSPGKHHFYWLVDGDMDLDCFAAIMEVMVDRYGSDPNAKDLTRVLRLPGTIHRKGVPHEVELENSDGRRYTVPS